MTRDTIIQTAATLAALGAVGFIVGMLAWIMLWPRKPLPQRDLRVRCDTTELRATLDALDRVIRTLEAYELEEYTGVVQEAETVLEQYQARLESEKEG